MAEPSQIQSFFDGARVLELPFDLSIGQTIFTMTETLRLLPAKRVVFAAETVEWGQVVIKLFALNKKGQRELAREQRGHQLALSAGVKIAPLLASYDEIRGCSAIVYKFLSQAKPLKIKKSILSSKQQKIKRLFEMVAQLHQYGIYQEDIHLDNILQQAGELYLIDLGSVRCEQEGTPLSKQKSLENIALLIAQFKPNKQKKLQAGLSNYYQTRGWPFDEDEQQLFGFFLRAAWQKRKQKFLAKQFRETTATVYYKSAAVEYAFERDFWDALPDGFVAQINDYVAKGELLKDGNSATVIHTVLAGKPVVIKRYNVKGKTHFIRRCLRESRAAVSWRNAHLLQFVGIRTPKALGFVEVRKGFLRTAAYFISRYEPATEMQEVYEHRLPRQKEVKQLEVLFSQLGRELISHGDLKARNLLIDERGKISLIDLDAMKSHSTEKAYLPYAEKDWQRFMANWQGSDVYRMLNSLRGISHIGGISKK